MGSVTDVVMSLLEDNINGRPMSPMQAGRVQDEINRLRVIEQAGRALLDSHPDYSWRQEELAISLRAALENKP